jgi:hypothetical protein
LAACLVAMGGAAGLAVGWKAQKHVSDILASGCRVFFDSAVDKVIEGLFYEDTFVANCDK